MSFFKEACSYEELSGAWKEGSTQQVDVVYECAECRESRRPGLLHACRPHTGDGGCRDRNFQRRRLGAKLELGDVAAFGDLDSQGRSSAFGCVIFLQPLAQFAGFHANDGVHLGVKIITPVEHFRCEHQFLDPVGLARQRLLDDVSKKTPGADGCNEWVAAKNRLQLLAHHFSRW